MAALLGNRREVEEQRAPRPSTQARRPFDGVAVANAVRRRLGVPLPGEPARELPRPGGPPSAGPSNN
jgi:hypothetical protein